MHSILNKTYPDQYIFNQFNKYFNQLSGHFKRIKWLVMVNVLCPEMTHSIEVVRCNEWGGRVICPFHATQNATVWLTTGRTPTPNRTHAFIIGVPHTHV